MKRPLKALCMVLSASMLLSSTAFAAGTPNEDKQNNNNIYVMSPEFPDAYIIVNTPTTNKGVASPNATQDGKITLGSFSATVFVEEELGYEDGEEVVTSSRLLSKDEVDAIGLENLEAKDANVYQEPTAKLCNAGNNHYKLTISEDGNYHYSGNGVTAYMNGSANWSGFNTFYSAKENPAVGNDYIGFAWSGDFTSSQSYAEAYWHATNNPATITLSTGVPNAA